MPKKETLKSKEDYLEAILIIIKTNGACRVTDIARQIGFSKASTSVALNKLEEDGLVVRDDWRILLTEEGRKMAEGVYEKHKLLRAWFLKLGVSEKTAEEDACLIEHVISSETYEKLKEHIMSL